MPTKPEDSLRPVRWVVGGVFFALLAAAFYSISRPFISPVSWAIIMVMGAWPVHSRVSQRWPKWPGLSALLSSVLMVLVALAILVPIMLGLGPELTVASQNVVKYARENQPFFMEKAASIPYVGDLLAEKMSTLPSETGELGSLLLEYSGTLLGTAGVAAQGAVWLVFNVSFFFLAVFFLFYYGEALLQQLDAAMNKMDTTTEKFTLLVERTVTGVLYGLVFTAIAQGFLAGLGFAMVGVRAPVLLGLATALLSFVPVGPPMIYLPVALSLFLNGAPFRGLLLAVWGVVLVSSADNILKPYFISRQAELPFPLVLLGVSGGVLAFGLIGVFVGPVVVGLVLALWKGWLEPEVLEEPEEPEELEGPEEPKSSEETLVQEQEAVEDLESSVSTCETS